MSISWRGHGYLGFMVPLVCAALSTAISGPSNMRSMRVALLVAAAAVWFAGRKLNAEALEDGTEPPHQAFGFSLHKSALIPLVFFVLTFT